MIPVTEEEGKASEFLSTQIPSHFYFLLMFFFESQVPKPVPYYAVQTRTDGEKLCWKGLWRATEKRNMTTQCVTHQLAAATSPSTRRTAFGTCEPARPWYSEGAGRLQEGSTMSEQSFYLCFLENTNKERNSRTANKRDRAEGQPGKWLAVPLCCPSARPQSALACCFTSHTRLSVSQRRHSGLLLV